MILIAYELDPMNCTYVVSTHGTLSFFLLVSFSDTTNLYQKRLLIINGYELYAMNCINDFSNCK